MAKVYLSIREGCKEYDLIKDWIEGNIHRKQMLGMYLRETKDCGEGCSLSGKYIFIDNPRAETLLENFPHVKQISENTCRFNSHSILYKGWIKYMEENYVDDLGEITDLKELLNREPEKVIYYLKGKEVLVEATIHQQDRIPNKYYEKLKERIINEPIKMLSSIEMIQKTLGGTDARYEYRRD